ncbi:MAG: peptidase S1 and S6, chymotrypsin/Hap [uncultured bacterium (gcode 4)]|uniref:Peptidase S1 and S6, chymotrypsin/Hap n=1 Tax=uncultured bacterium (gcode 4) TaxID=1234023 RepID=K2G7G0_9BACT|nr:MAG: peptidase S1 and S6, chymotrypsin/Hap [uncultured bacterium (gcode 4)]
MIKPIYILATLIMSFAISESSIAFDQKYFDSLPEDDKKIINIIKTANPTVVSITWKKSVSETKSECYLYINWICITSWDLKSITRSWSIDFVKGSWFFLSRNWFIITNRHVVDQDDLKYEVTTLDGKVYPATILSVSETDDLALLKISWNNFPFLKLSDSNNLMIWQTIFAIGNTLWEYQNTVTQWIISWLNRNIIAWWQDDESEEELNWVIQTSASVSLWNSWWPVIDSLWNSIWIYTAIDIGWQNIGFAIPANKIVDFLKSYRISAK